jgi:hypothetical protein
VAATWWPTLCDIVSGKQWVTPRALFFPLTTHYSLQVIS